MNRAKKYLDRQRKTQPWWAILATGLFLFFLAYNLLVLGALAQHPVVGEPLRRMAESEAWITASYMSAGKHLPAPGALGGWAQAEADAIAGGIASRITSYPPGAIATLFGEPASDAQGHWQWCYRGAQISLLAAIILWVFSARSVHLIANRRG